jgi:hypothetical protein
MSDGVITLEEIHERARGKVIEIPDWDGQGTIRVRARKIDITPLVMKAGVIPNQLKLKAQEMFEGKISEKDIGSVDVDVEKMMPVLDAAAKEALVEPKYEEIQEILPLTLNQKLAIFSFVSEEVQQLESFRGTKRKHG